METTLTFTKFKETKNTVRYQEQGQEGSFVIGPLYVQKSYLGNPIPDTLTVIVKKT